MSNQEPLVSAIMPTYNGASHLAASIESVIGQTYTNWELIIVDDGSTDDTFAIASQYASQDRRVKPIRIAHCGRGAARNECLKRLSGKYVAMCDSDDLSLPQRFAVQVELLENHPEVGVTASYEVMAFSDDPDTTYLICSPRAPAEIRRKFARGRMPIQNASAMVRAELYAIYGDYDEQLRRAQDYEWYLRMYRDVRFMTTPALIKYRTGNLMVSRAHMTENNLYRYYATRRARGEPRTFDEFYARPIPRIYRRFVVPAMYMWYLMRRRILRLDIRSGPTVAA